MDVIEFWNFTLVSIGQYNLVVSQVVTSIVLLLFTFVASSLIRKLIRKIS